MHEDFSRAHTVKTSSNRAFGLVMAVFFLIVTGLPLVRGHAARWWTLIPAVAFAALALVRPAALAPLNWVWTRFGLLLHRGVSPVVLAAVFYGAVAPLGLLMRAAGKDPLRLRRDPAAASYWIPRTPPGPSPESMRQQF